jgi:hypothetical protein
MPSADFWLLTRYVAMPGAAGFVMRRCLFCDSLRDSYPLTATGHAGFLANRVNPFQILLNRCASNLIDRTQAVGYTSYNLRRDPHGYKSSEMGEQSGAPSC